MFQGLSIIWHLAILHFFLWLNYVPLPGCTLLFSHSSAGHLGSHVLCFDEHLCASVCGNISLKFSGIYLGEESLGHIITLCLTFCRPAKLFSSVAAPFYIPTCNLWVFQFFHVLSNTCSYLAFFFYYGHHNGREVVSHVILICISLMTDNVTHLFVCLLAVCVFGEVPTLILCPLFNQVFVFSLLSCKSSSYVLDTRPSSDTWFADIFSCGLWFCFLDRVLGHKIYILKVNWFERGKMGLLYSGVAKKISRCCVND